jgi:hypothetical protein
MIASGSTFSPYSSLSSLQGFPRLGDGRAQHRAILGPEDDVLDHGEVLHQLEMLVHHADAGADRGLAVGDVGLLAVDEDLALIGLVETVEDRHQRRFAGAVFAHDTVDRALGDGHGDVLVGLHRAEGLGDALQFDGWHGCGHLSSPGMVRCRTGRGSFRTAARAGITLAELHCICTGQVPSSLKLCTTISPAMIAACAASTAAIISSVISSALNSSSA